MELCTVAHLLIILKLRFSTRPHYRPFIQIANCFIFWTFLLSSRLDPCGVLKQSWSPIQHMYCILFALYLWFKMYVYPLKFLLLEGEIRGKDGAEIILAVLGNPRISAFVPWILTYKRYTLLFCPTAPRLGKAGVADKNQCGGGCSGGCWKLGVSLIFLVAGMDNRVGSVPKGVQKDDPYDGLNSAGFA